MGVPNIIIDDVTIQPLRRLPSSSHTANLVLRQSSVRSQSGKLFVQTLFKKYTIALNGLSQELYEDLRRVHESSTFVDFFTIVNRKEVFTGDGTTTEFFTTRRIRIDDGDVAPIVETPPGTVISPSTLTITNTATRGSVVFDLGPPAIGVSIVVRYFPIVRGVITVFDSSLNWVRGEETWSLIFEEE